MGGAAWAQDVRSAAIRVRRFIGSSDDSRSSSSRSLFNILLNGAILKEIVEDSLAQLHLADLRQVDAALLAPLDVFFVVLAVLLHVVGRA